jgi:hypothetical protein
VIVMLCMHFLTRFKNEGTKLSVCDFPSNTKKVKALQFDIAVWEVVKSSVIRTFFFMFFRAELKLETNWKSLRLPFF